MSEANARQVGGDHYSKSIQHWDVVVDSYGVGYLIGCATKYVSRHDKKNGAQDLEKAEHYLQKAAEKLIEGADWPGVPNGKQVGRFAQQFPQAEADILIDIFFARGASQLKEAALRVAKLRVDRYGE